MNRKLVGLISLSLSLSFTLTACSVKTDKSSEDGAKTNRVEVATDKEDKKKEDKKSNENNQKLSHLYNKILDNIDSYEFSDVEEGKYTYSYALVKTDKSDYPGLLVGKDMDYSLSYLKLFTANDDFTGEYITDELLTIGVAAAGGFRGRLSQNADYDALIYTTFMSGTGEGEQEKITTSITNDALKFGREVIWEGKIDALGPDDSKEIEFFRIEDRDKINDLASIKDGEYIKFLNQAKDKKEESKENTAGSLEGKIKAERDAGNMVATGKVKVFNHDEMIAYQNQHPEMFPDMGENYTVLILDKPMDFTLQSGGGGGNFTRSANLISLPKDMMSYKGKRITISFAPSDGHWQSDVSLPMDAPRMHQVKVLE